MVYNNDAIRPAFLIVYGEEIESNSEEGNGGRLMGLVKRLFRIPLAA